MIVILGLVILVAAVIAGVAGVLANGGHAHAVTHFRGVRLPRDRLDRHACSCTASWSGRWHCSG